MYDDWEEGKSYPVRSILATVKSDLPRTYGIIWRPLDVLDDAMWGMEGWGE